MDDEGLAWVWVLALALALALALTGGFFLFGGLMKMIIVPLLVSSSLYILVTKITLTVDEMSRPENRLEEITISIDDHAVCNRILLGLESPIHSRQTQPP